MSAEQKDKYDHSDHSVQHREKDDLGAPGQHPESGEERARQDQQRREPVRDES